MILALETSTTQGCLTLLDPSNGEVVGSVVFHSERAHNSDLFPALQELLAQAPAPLTLLVVGTGPGSYGGVRSGISAALGLSMARRCPAVGIPSIATLAPDALVVGDARRSAYFTAEIRDHQLVAFPTIHDEPSFRARVSEAQLPLVTMDAQPPLGLPGMESSSPPPPAWPCWHPASPKHSSAS